ncbi:DUF1501 domain-containing protein [Pseudomarimonas salicorniae]|uniref:DUF1501 domain-containing protein n=1 Tax=Pseudomarimonas salicorniae TaxID=2933270 RepID=A0ABT0GJP5_9GAMM|nr:DUF1501 domain-containing protein [Lysobacter sp. CAU 1642]MCK7594766.1 DUF1501 domain-containing protein [Lysobacter sp. CAU 1642]
MSRNASSRRNFLRASCGVLACGGAQALFPQLGLIPSALAQSVPATGYKALVCLYLAGGNDSWNLLMPGGGNAWNLYRDARNGVYATGNTSGLALPAANGTGFIANQTTPAAIGINGNAYGVNPFCPELAQLYNEGRLAFLPNIGSLVEPITRATYSGSGARRRPPQLYSHNDQTSLWHTGGNNLQATRGWGGMVAGRTSKLASEMSGLPPVITLSGQTRFLNGTSTISTPLFPFTLSTSSTSPAASLIEYGISNRNANQFQTARQSYLDELLEAASPQPFTDEYRSLVTRSIELANDVINPAFATIATDDPVNAPFNGLSGNNLYSQLRQIARMIKVSTDASLANPINANRQVFFVSIGGWDTHDNQISSIGATGHHGRLQVVSQAVNAFFRSMQAIGQANNVTLFSASEFGRTINSNGNGSDHAWGGVQFAVGGAVNGGIYGRYPSIALNNSLTNPVAGSDPTQGECFSRGQFLPTTAVDQLGATLARWMGVADSDLPSIFANIDNFASGPYANAAATPTFAHFSRTIPGLMNGI